MDTNLLIKIGFTKQVFTEAVSQKLYSSFCFSYSMPLWVIKSWFLLSKKVEKRTGKLRWLDMGNKSLHVAIFIRISHGIIHKKWQLFIPQSFLFLNYIKREEKNLEQWLPATAPGTTSAPWAVIKCYLKKSNSSASLWYKLC